MDNLFHATVAPVLLGLLHLLRGVLQSDARLYVCLGHPSLQPLLVTLGRAKAYRVYRKARRECPGYRAFLAEHPHEMPHGPKQLTRVPITDKESYVKRFAIEARCYGGRIPPRGVVIDESSGSSGVPNNWVRGREERASVRKMLQLAYALNYREPEYFFLNCFALGPWATGMNVTMSMADVTIMKSIGPDIAKLDNTLKTFGTRYRYLIAGYPPFVKSFLDTTTVDLRGYELHLIVGGEGMSEGLRAHFLRTFKSVCSSYGASDLEINIGVETDLTTAIRQQCAARPALCKSLFGREDVPMLFQYNPLDYLVECSDRGELVFTICRTANVAPKVRYNLHDLGGSLTYRQLMQQLRATGVDRAALPRRHLAFPILFVYGRNDLSVPFYGAKVFPSDLDHILHADPALIAAYHSFQLRTIEDAQLNKTLVVILEHSQRDVDRLTDEALRTIIFDGLVKINQDFREVSKLFTRQQLRVEQRAYGTGPFASRDIRVKQRYIAAS